MPLLGNVDEPAPGTVHDRWVRVRGWAFDPEVPVSRVEVLLDGRPAGRMGLGRLRADVAESLADPAAELSGFEGEVPVGRVADAAGRDVRLTVRVFLLDGNAFDLSSTTVAVRPWVGEAVAGNAAGFELVEGRERPGSSGSPAGSTSEARSSACSR